METPRTASVIATKDCITFQLRRARYHSALQSVAERTTSPDPEGWRERLQRTRSQHKTKDAKQSTGRGSSSDEASDSGPEASTIEEISSSGKLLLSPSAHTQDKYASDEPSRGQRRRHPRRDHSEHGTHHESARLSAISVSDDSADDSSYQLSDSSVSSVYDSQDEEVLAARSSPWAAIERKFAHALHEERRLRQLLEKRVATLDKMLQVDPGMGPLGKPSRRRRKPKSGKGRSKANIR